MNDLRKDSERIDYRLALVDPGSGDLLFERDTRSPRLPRIQIEANSRAGLELRRAIRHTFGLDVLILDFMLVDGPSAPVAFVEVVGDGQGTGLMQASIAQVPRSELAEEERRRLVNILQGEDSNPFACVGWIKKAIVWLEEATGRAVSAQSGFEQFNAGFGFMLMRFRMEDDSVYWLKATGEPNVHECAVTAHLFELCGEYLPSFVASCPAWKAWITKEDATSLECLSREDMNLESVLPRAVRSMAALQTTTIGHTADLLDAGAFDHGLATLLSRSEEVFSYVEEAMGRQTSIAVEQIRAPRLREMRAFFEAACIRMGRLELPETVIHGDINLGNILVGRPHCQFIDWAEAYVGNPLVTLQHLLLLNPVVVPDERAQLERRLKAEFLTSFSEFCDASKVEEGFCYMPLVAAFSALYGRGDWLTTDARREPRRQTYARTLARYMDRAARDLQHCAAFSGAYIAVPADLKKPASAEIDIYESVL